MSRLKFCVIGAGRIAGLLEADSKREKPCTHIGAIQHNRDLELVGLYDIDYMKMAATKQLFGLNEAVIFSNYTEMLREKRPDIIAIATPPETHLKILEDVINLSPESVIILEKPVSVNYVEAQSFYLRNQGRLRQVIINHERRFSNNYIYVKKKIDSGFFGKLLSVSAKLFFGKNRSIDDILLDDGTHMIDIIRHLIDDDIFFETITGDDTTNYINFKTPKCIGVIEIGNGRDYLLFEIDLIFNKGRIWIGNGVLKEEKSVDSPYYEKKQSLMPVTTSALNETGYFKNLYKHAFKLATKENCKSLSSFEDGLAALKFINEVKKRKEYNHGQK